MPTSKDSSTRLSQESMADEYPEADRLASRLIDVWIQDHGGIRIPWAKAIEIVAVVTKMPDYEKARLIHMDDPVIDQKPDYVSALEAAAKRSNDLLAKANRKLDHIEPDNQYMRFLLKNFVEHNDGGNSYGNLTSPLIESLLANAKRVLNKSPEGTCLHARVDWKTETSGFCLDCGIDRTTKPENAETPRWSAGSTKLTASFTNKKGVP